MAKNDKSEKATPQRRKEAREEGNIARSAEVPVFVGLAIGALVLRVFSPSMTATYADETRLLFSTLRDDRMPSFAELTQVGTVAAGILLPFLGAALLAALGSGFAMTKGNVSFKAAKPTWKKVSPKQGIEKFKPVKAGWELLRTLLKVGALFVVVWNPLMEVRSAVGGGRGVDDGVGALADLAWTVLLRGIALAAVIAALDYTYQRWQHEKNLRMSVQDIRDQTKNSEGDPRVKGERRRRQMQMSRNRMVADVATADVVLVNPTEYAVALRYEPGSTAPTVVAKGVDHLARRIRDEATRNGVPIRVDVALTRTLHRQVKVGDVVPESLYEAIAVVLVWAYRRAGRRRTPVTATVGAR